MSNRLDFGIQSFCFRNFKSNKDVVKKVKEIGLDKIEICEVHADFKDAESWKEVVHLYQNSGVSIISIGVQTFTGDPSEKLYFECAAIAGAKTNFGKIKRRAGHICAKWCPRQYWLRLVGSATQSVGLWLRSVTLVKSSGDFF